MSKKDIKKIVLAYSGGLDTSIILKWLKEQYHCEVIAYCADLGQEEELTGLEEKAANTGASACRILDLKDEFVADYVYPMLRANAAYEHDYLLGTSIARPLIAKKQIEIAREFGADAVAHGATGKGNDQVRFELTFQALAPDLAVVAPWRIWDLHSRTQLLNYAKKHGIPVPESKVKDEDPYSMDRNMLHISYEGGILEDPWQEPHEDMFLLTTSPEKAPDKPQVVEIEYEKGDAVAVDGQKLKPASLLAKLNEYAGKHGIGRIDIVENRFVGMKSRGVYETPGGTILHAAHRALESITLDREATYLKDSLVPKYAQLVYNGFWFSPEREALQALVDQTQAYVTGVVRLKLYKGGITTLGRKSPYSLFSEAFATFEKDDVYDHKDAEGFIRLQGLRLRLNGLRELNQQKK